MFDTLGKLTPAMYPGRREPPTAQGQSNVPRTVGGPAAVRNALTHRAGHTHSPRTVGGPALAGVNFLRVSTIKPIPPHIRLTLL